MSALSLEQGPNYNLNQIMPRAILLLLTVTAAWGIAAASVAPQLIHYTGKIGHIVRLQDGRLLTLYTLGRADEDSSLNGPEQPAYVRYSGDRGHSWSKARIAFSFASGRGTMPTYRQSTGPRPAPGPGRNRPLACHPVLSRPQTRRPDRGRVSELFHNRSRNGGRTWSPSRLIAGPSTPEPENVQMRNPFLAWTGDGSVLLRYHRIERTLGTTRRDLLRLDPERIAE